MAVVERKLQRLEGILLEMPTVAAGKAPPTEFCLFKSGVNATTKGPVLVDADGLAAVMAVYTERGLDKLPIDYNHGMVYGGTGIEGGKAAGWFVPASRNGELWATHVEWLEAAHTALSRREYRFFSPAIMQDYESGQIRELINVALTNLPATNGQKPLVASAHGAEMDPKLIALCAAHGCSDIEGLTAKMTELSAQAASGAKAAETLATLTAQVEKDKREALVQTLSREGKLPPSLHEWARTQTLASLEAFGKVAPAVAQPAAVTQPTPETPSAVDSDAKVMLRAFGMVNREDEFLRMQKHLETTGGVLRPSELPANVLEKRA